MISGDKATTELEAMENGILRIPSGSPPPGEEVAVGTVLACLVAPGEELPTSNRAEAQRIVATPWTRRRDCWYPSSSIPRSGRWSRLRWRRRGSSTPRAGGRCRPEDLRDATFTITNLGMYEIDAFTPAVTLPQCAVLGVGRIVARPVVVDETSERVAVRRMVALSLSFDHRLVDGAPAARFLQTIKHFVERPTSWLFR